MNDYLLSCYLVILLSITRIPEKVMLPPTLMLVELAASDTDATTSETISISSLSENVNILTVWWNCSLMPKK